MRRLMAAGMCALILAATAVALPSPSLPTVDAASACTNWKSTKTPPSTIRVLRTYGPASGKVQVVSFRAYVENVMAWEWPDSFPIQALRAGAVAVKQYAWYYAKNWRGGTKSGACYDVKDTSADQVYRPETRGATSKQLRAVASTWNLTIRRKRDGKLGRFILTGYRPGSIKACGAEKNGFRLYQKGVKACAKKGLSSEQISRIYYGKTLELTETGRHNTVGPLFGAGDLGAAVPGGSGVEVHVHRSGGGAFEAGGEPTAIATSADMTLGRLSADIDGDGAEELVTLVADDATRQHLEVRQPDGFAFGEPEPGLSWDSGAAGVAFESWRSGQPGVRPVAADIDSDGDDDVLLVVAGDEPSTGSVHVLESLRTAFQPIVAAYAGPLPADTSQAYAADATGDGRSDVVLVTETAGGLSLQVMRTDATPPSDPIGIQAPAVWASADGLMAADARVVVTDYDRDSRDDVVLAIGTGSGVTFRAYDSTGSAFTAIDLGSSSIGLDRLKLVTSDVDNDGRGDIVAYAQPADGGPGTRLMVFRSAGTSLESGDLWLEDADLDWATVAPY